jgi:hypothetical protein
MNPTAMLYVAYAITVVVWFLARRRRRSAENRIITGLASAGWSLATVTIGGGVLMFLWSRLT